MHVRLTNISYIDALFEVKFIQQDSGLLGVLFWHVSLYIKNKINVGIQYTMSYPEFDLPYY